MKKQERQRSLHLLFSQKGSLTVQFIFAFMLVFGFIICFFYLSLTLVVGELVQYATYSSSRYLSLSHERVEEQRSASQIKYNTLLFGGGIFKSGFFGAIDADDKPFNLQRNIQNSAGLGLNSALPGMQMGRNLFYGVWTEFQPKGLSLKVPFWGDSVQGSEPNLFDSVIGSYLGREPSQQECENFAKDRWRMIKRVISSSPSPPGGYSGSGSSNDYTYSGTAVKQYDNGC